VTLALFMPVIAAGEGSPAPGPPPAGPEELQARRARLAAHAGPESIVILPAAAAPPRNGDTSYEFRQDSDIYYLTGIAQEGTALALIPGNREVKEILFLAPRNPAREVWDGRRLEAGEARRISGVATVWEEGDFVPFLEALTAGRAYRVDRYAASEEYRAFLAAREAGTAKLAMALRRPPGIQDAPGVAERLAASLGERRPALRFIDIAPELDRLRLIKSEAEIALLRRAIDITVEAHREGMRWAAPGLYEFEVEAAIEHVFRRQGASGWGFPSILGSGENSTTLHYQENSRRLEENDLMVVDIGAEYGLYTADVTRTVPASGRFTPDQAEIYSIVLAAQEAGMALVKPGATIQQIHARSAEVVREGLKRLGLIRNVATDEYRRFFMHGTCHWLGLEVHDVGERQTVLAPGMVLTVEPGIYVRADVLDHLEPTPENEKFKTAVAAAVKRYAGIGVRLEDDLLVTESGAINLSGALPRSIEEVEALMKEPPMWVKPRP
jgi:Xaa-Pro aminopeptidase